MSAIGLFMMTAFGPARLHDLSKGSGMKNKVMTLLRKHAYSVVDRRTMDQDAVNDYLDSAAHPETGAKRGFVDGGVGIYDTGLEAPVCANNIVRTILIARFSDETHHLRTLAKVAAREQPGGLG
jgi:ribose 5-phosphate isomerase RpiB